MKRLIAEWLWRAVLLGALSWIGLEVHALRMDLQPMPDEQMTAQAQPDDLQQGIDDLGEDMARLTEKVDALLIAMARMR